MSDPHAPHDDHGHGHPPPAAPAQPPMIAYVAPAPGWPQHTPFAPSAMGHCCCGGATPTILQPWPSGGGFMVCCRVCGLAKDDHGHGGHDEHKEPAPEFSDAVPEEFRARFKDVWHAVQENRIPAGIIADCHALLLVLLKGLDGQDPKAGKKETPSGCFSFGGGGAATPVSGDLGLLKRIKALREKGRLLESVEKSAGPIRLDPGDLDMAPLGDPERARRYMNLIWQIADQGYEQVRWSERSQSPPRAKAPETKDHGGHGT